MSDERIKINDSSLESVVGGLFTFHKTTQVLDYTHPDGTVTYHKILNYQKAWEMSNSQHAKFIKEDDILQNLIDAKYIEG